MTESNIPKGVLDEPFLKRLLHRFIDMLDKQQSRLSLKISRKNTPELFQFTDKDPAYLWMLIESLDTEYQVLTITLANTNRSQEIYEGATLRFHREQETLVRHWLDRPATLNKMAQWQQALEHCSYPFTPEQYALLQQKPITHHNRSPDYILAALGRANDLLKKTSTPLSPRNLSARCFDGDSKCLDRYADFLPLLFSDNKHQLKKRPLLLSLALPPTIENILFIENQETFLDCVKHHTHPLIRNSALVYSAGFRAAAERSRDLGSVTFAYTGNVAPGTRDIFQQWWEHNHKDWPCYFWGDLDYSGMAILASLRSAFPQLQAWQPGYELMLRYHQRGLGHALSDAKKDAQKPPSQTGCAYADNTLLPLMHASQRFLDQEVVSLGDFSGNT